MKLHSDRIIVREFQVNDLNDFYEFASNKDVGYYAGWKPHDNIKISEKVLFGKIVSPGNYAICLKDTGKLIGSVELTKSTTREKVIAFELGFALNVKYWGLGYIQEAARLVIEYAFTKLNAEVLEICHMVENIRSEEAIKKLGFIYEGTLRNYKKLYDGRIVNVKIYSILKDEYERMKENERIKK